MVESRPSKPLVAGSIPVSRSTQLKLLSERCFQGPLGLYKDDAAAYTSCVCPSTRPEAGSGRVTAFVAHVAQG